MSDVEKERERERNIHPVKYIHTYITEKRVYNNRRKIEEYPTTKKGKRKKIRELEETANEIEKEEED